MRITREVGSNKIIYENAGFFILRTPILPYTDFIEWGNSSTATDADVEKFTAELREKIRQHLSTSKIQEAIYIASPSLFNRIHYWKDNPNSEKGRKIEFALVKYFSRMCSRSTPFGTFAGVSTGLIANHTLLQLSCSDNYKRHVRFDTGYICTLSALLSKIPQIRNDIHFFPNDTLYQIGEKYRFVEYGSNGGARTFRLSDVDKSSYLDTLLEMARTGDTLANLASTLSTGEDVELSEASSFIDELVECKILISELEPKITGREPFEHFLDVLQKYRQQYEGLDKIFNAHAQIQQLNKTSLGASTNLYKEISDELHDLDVPQNMAHLLQVDLFKPVENLAISSELTKELGETAALLFDLSPSYLQNMEDLLTRFRERFDHQEISLMHALDEENGLAFGENAFDETPLLRGMKLNKQSMPAKQPQSPVEAYLISLLCDSFKNNTTEVVLDPKILQGLKKNTVQLSPQSFCANVNLLENKNTKEKITFVRYSTVSVSSLLGRFCHGDMKLRELVRTHTKKEADLYPDCIIAEIVHLPRGRTGNIIARPDFTDFEIVYLGRSGVPAGNQIPVSDLFLSIRQGEFRLWSKKFQKRIIPRLSSAHNYHGAGNLGVYRFLASMQGGSAGVLHFDWPASVHNVRYLPRLKLGNLYLTKARWNLHEDDIDLLRCCTNDNLMNTIHHMRLRCKMPRVVSIVEGDNVLAIDLQNILSIQTFVSMLNGRKRMMLEEVTGDDEQFAVTGPEGIFANEIMIPFLQSLPASNKQPGTGAHARSVNPAPVNILMKLQRTFTPGDEWLYLKIYCGTTTADRILRLVFRDLVDASCKTRSIDSWFFIRYADPQSHIRLRLQIGPGSQAQDILKTVNEHLLPLVETGAVWKIQLDTYEREIERYGGTRCMESCERIFSADSDAVVNLLRCIGSHPDETRTAVAYMGVDKILDDFQISNPNKALLLRELARDFSKEFNLTLEQEVNLGKKYRIEKEDITAALCGSDEGEGYRPECIRIFAFRSLVIRRESEFIKKVSSAEGASQICCSIIHMFINRLIRSNHRAHELVIYDLMRRHYESLQGRKSMEASL